jgi:hypothetical protein
MTRRAYAADTSVSTEKSRAEIEATLRRYGADRFAYATEPGKATVMFAIAGRQIRFLLTLPKPDERQFTHHSRGVRSAAAAQQAWEQACRQKWRALALVIKAKLEAAAAGITTIEDEFLAHTMLPDRQTVSEWMQPQVAEAYRIGSMPTALMLEGPRQ